MDFEEFGKRLQDHGEKTNRAGKTMNGFTLSVIALVVIAVVVYVIWPS